MSSTESTRLGILDWGIGGTGFYRAWRERRPDVPVVYWSDTGATPYGRLPEDELRTRVESVCEALRRRGARHVAVACNAASTVVGRLNVGMPVEGIVEHAVDTVCEALEAETESDGGSESDETVTVGVLGGRRTIDSELYQTKLEARGLEVDARVAQSVSGLVERGIVSGPALKHTLEPILEGLEEVEAVLLACTHYPAVRGSIQTMLPGVPLLDPVERWVDRLSRKWPETENSPASPDCFVTTGDPEALVGAAEAAFDVRPDHIESV